MTRTYRITTLCPNSPVRSSLSKGELGRADCRGQAEQEVGSPGLRSLMKSRVLGFLQMYVIRSRSISKESAENTHGDHGSEEMQPKSNVIWGIGTEI